MKFSSSSIVAIIISSSIIAANSDACTESNCACTVATSDTPCPDWFVTYFGAKYSRLGSTCIGTNELFKGQEPCKQSKPEGWPEFTSDVTSSPTSTPPVLDGGCTESGCTCLITDSTCPSWMQEYYTDGGSGQSDQCCTGGTLAFTTCSQAAACPANKPGGFPATNSIPKATAVESPASVTSSVVSSIVIAGLVLVLA